jgi:O-antigen ligase
MATLDTAIPRTAPKKRDYLKGAFAWLLVFCFVYFARPEEFIPIGTFPIAKLTGGLAIASFGLVVMAHPKLLSFSWEMRYLMLLSLWFFLGFPFSPLWKGGAFQHSLDFAKVVPIALLIGLVANSVPRLKRLIFVETASTVGCVIVTLFASHFHASEEHRLTGSLNGIYGNPNDLALCIVLVFPFCAMFMLTTLNIFKKMLWTMAMLLLGYALLLTYSRAGVLALLISGCVMVWEFGLKGRRHGLIMMAAFLALCVFVIGGPKGFLRRVGSVVAPSLDPGSASGSWHARKALLLLSLKETVTHPIFGVGCGNFQIISEAGWHVTHNTYTQLSAEGGILALILYVLIIRRTFINLREAERFSAGRPDLLLIGGALRVSFAGFLAGSFFDSVAYNFFPYFLIAYSGALLQISMAMQGSGADAQAVAAGGGASKNLLKGVPRKQAVLSHGINGYRPPSGR